MKTVIRILLGIAIVFLGYICVMSVMTPIQFEKEQKIREKEVVKKLIDLRTAQIEFKEQNRHYTASMDTLITFIKTAKKKEVMKEGALTDAQLEAGLTEAKAVKIIQKGNKKEIEKNGLQNFRRDTIYTDLIQSLYKGAYTPGNIDQLAIVPYSSNMRFEMEVNNGYVNSSGIKIPLFEVRTPYQAYLSDLNHQELINTIDVAVKLERYPGLKVGSVVEPNNNAGNWE